MRTIKKGDTGKEVRLLQEMIGVTADGIFGAITESKVKAYQRAHNLVADGIVGAKTWAALGYKSEDTAKNERADKGADKPAITAGYIHTHITHSKGRPVKYIAIHYTAGASSAAGRAMSTRNVFLKRAASADFVVDDRDIVQINPDLRNYYCWSVGDKKNPYTGGGRLYGKATNKNTISIEICSNLKSGTSASAANHSGWYYTEASLDNARKLVRWLMSEFGVPKANVVRHYDVSGKMCPGVVGWNNAKVYDTNGKATNANNNSDKWESFWESI